MKRFVKTLAVAAVVVVWAAPACFARDGFFADPEVDYSADEVIIAEGAEIVSKVYYSPKKLRKEEDFGGSPNITIVRHDLGLLWVVIPEDRQYIESTIKKVQEMAGDVPGQDDEDKVDITEVGQEDVNGVVTTKSKVVITDTAGETSEGFAWRTADGIIVRMESQMMTQELKNLKVEPQGPELFELPDGYEKIPMPGMME